MRSDSSPLNILSAWYQTLPKHIANHLAQSVVMFTSGDILLVSSESLVLWLNGEGMSPSVQIGRTLCASAFIDFEMEEKSRAEYWEAELNYALELAEAPAAPVSHAVVNEAIGSVEKVRGEWMAAAQSWRDLRAVRLNNDEIRGWLYSAGEIGLRDLGDQG